MAIRLDAHRDEQHRDQQWHKPCRVATTADITISTALNAGDTIDGITLAAGDRVLVKNQGTGSQNGIYIAGAVPARAYDMLVGIQALGAVVKVLVGTTNGETYWECSNTTLPTIDTDALTWQAFSGGGGAPTTDAILRYDFGAEWFLDHGVTGATETIDGADGNAHWITLDADCTLTFTGAVADIGGQDVQCGFTLYVEQDGTGGWEITWPVSVIWPGGLDPTLSTDPASVDVFSFLTPNGGTDWYGFAGPVPAAAGDTVVSETTFGQSPDAGVSSAFSRDDHTHGTPAEPSGGGSEGGFLLLADVHSSPIVFDDILQADDFSDFLYSEG